MQIQSHLPLWMAKGWQFVHPLAVIAIIVFTDRQRLPTMLPKDLLCLRELLAVNEDVDIVHVATASDRQVGEQIGCPFEKHNGFRKFLQVTRETFDFPAKLPLEKPAHFFTRL